MYKPFLKPALLGLLPACLILLAGTSIFTPINVCATCSTQPLGINNRGEISGSYFDSSGTSHGFVKTSVGYVPFDGTPDAIFTEGGHINNKGQAAGDSMNAVDLIDRTFIRNPDGTIDHKPGFPGAAITFASGINDFSHLVGSYTLDPTGSTGFTGYVLRGDVFTQTFSVPSAVNTFALDVNNRGTIVGSYGTGVPCAVPVCPASNPNVEHGFIRDPEGRIQQLDVPGSVQTEAFGIHNSGDIVGRYLDRHGDQHGFKLQRGIFITIEYENPNHNPNMYVWGINEDGDIVGYTFPGDPAAGRFSGFELESRDRR